MLRVVSVKDERTLVVEARGEVRLAGVEIVDRRAARELLAWSVDQQWVMLEPAGNGEFLVYRSPDALFVNRELVQRGFARATLPGIEPFARVEMHYLGEVNPGPAPSTSTARTTKAAPESRTRTAPAGRHRGARARATASPRARSGGAGGSRSPVRSEP